MLKGMFSGDYQDNQDDTAFNVSPRKPTHLD